jgi:hypothetical protein
VLLRIDARLEPDVTRRDACHDLAVDVGDAVEAARPRRGNLPDRRKRRGRSLSGVACEERRRLKRDRRVLCRPLR